ncbi:MAG: hypothetical protein ACLUVG_01785 [Phocaeicola vulgatus]
MKELNLKQMESVNGGLESDCKGALVSLGMGVAGVVLSVASLGSGLCRMGFWIILWIIVSWHII